MTYINKEHRQLISSLIKMPFKNMTLPRKERLDMVNCGLDQLHMNKLTRAQMRCVGYAVIREMIVQGMDAQEVITGAIHLCNTLHTYCNDKNTADQFGHIHTVLRIVEKLHKNGTIPESTVRSFVCTYHDALGDGELSMVSTSDAQLKGFVTMWNALLYDFIEYKWLGDAFNYIDQIAPYMPSLDAYQNIYDAQKQVYLTLDMSVLDAIKNDYYVRKIKNSQEFQASNLEY